MSGPATLPVGRPAHRRVQIMGARVGALSRAEAASAIVDGAGKGLWTVTANLDHLRSFHREPLSRDLIEEADLVVADGTPLVWASLIAGTPLPERVAGSDLIWSVCEEAARRRVSVFLLGGNEGTADRAARALARRYRGLAVAGTICPPLGFERDDAELERIERQVLAAEPGVVLLGLGFPKQDLLIRRLRSVLPGASFLGVGASFEFVSGEIPRAPRWTHGPGLEWVYRLWKEPRRLANRYLVKGVPFALRLLTSATRYRVLPGASTEWGWEREGGLDP